jgi:hypothetical protein
MDDSGLVRVVDARDGFDLGGGEDGAGGEFEEEEASALFRLKVSRGRPANARGADMAEITFSKVE